MQYNYIVVDNGLIKQYFTSDHEISDIAGVVLIPELKYEELEADTQSGKLIYLDDSVEPDGSGNQFKTRDRLTKLVDNEWIPDIEAMATDAQNILIKNAISKFIEYEIHATGYKFSKLTEQQKADLYNYLDALEDIIQGVDTVSTELPVEPFEI